MAGLLTTIQDVMNPHKRFVIRSPVKKQITAGQIRRILRRERVVTWGWEVAEERIAFRVYGPHRFTAKGVLEQEGVEVD